jgi:hypothetical protein
MPDRRRKKTDNGPSEDPRPPNDDLNHLTQNRCNTDRRLLTVLFGERELQKTIDIDASTTVAQAKKIGADELLKSLRLLPDAPSALVIDETCTDFYPGIIWQSQMIV